MKTLSGIGLMPPPRDLTDQRFGLLTVVGPAPDHPTSTRPRQWMCRCDCGVILPVLHRRLTAKSERHQRHACDDCRAKTCVICEGPISPSSTSKTCSVECRAEHRRRCQLTFYHEKRVVDPVDTEKRRARGRERWARMSPDEKLAVGRQRRASEDRETINARARESYSKRMEDPDYAERVAATRRAWSEKNPDKIAAYQRRHKRKLRQIKAAQELSEFLTSIEDDKKNE